MFNDECEFSPASFSGTARLFPLPDLVLFPHVMQPLHIFEPRYREMLEEALGHHVPDNIRESIGHGAGELDLVRSGLDDTMRLAYQEIRETILAVDNIHDLRTATYVTAIKKIARSYLEVGVF